MEERKPAESLQNKDKVSGPQLDEESLSGDYHKFIQRRRWGMCVCVVVTFEDEVCVAIVLIC